MTEAAALLRISEEVARLATTTASLSDEVGKMRERMHQISGDTAAVRIIIANVHDHETRIRSMESEHFKDAGEKSYKRWFFTVVLFQMVGLALTAAALMTR